VRNPLPIVTIAPVITVGFHDRDIGKRVDMVKRWGQRAAFAACVVLSACGGGGGDEDPSATPAAVAPEAALQSLLEGLPPTVVTPPTDPVELAAFLAAQALPSKPANGAYTVLGPTWLAGVGHQVEFGSLLGQLSADTTAGLAVPYSTPTQELRGGADLLIGRIDGDVKVGETTSARQFTYVVAQPSSSLPETGTVSYSLSQATAVDVRVNGQSQPAAARATITAATLTANFAADAAAPLTMTLTGTLGAQTYTASLPVSSPTSIDRSTASFSSDNGGGTVITGVFTGASATEVGVHYTITISGGTLNGSLILQRAPEAALR
jgi:hypothetical protein